MGAEKNGVDQLFGEKIKSADKLDLPHPGVTFDFLVKNCSDIPQSNELTTAVPLLKKFASTVFNGLRDGNIQNSAERCVHMQESTLQPILAANPQAREVLTQYSENLIAAVNATRKSKTGEMFLIALEQLSKLLPAGITTTFRLDSNTMYSTEVTPNQLRELANFIVNGPARHGFMNLTLHSPSTRINLLKTAVHSGTISNEVVSKIKHSLSGKNSKVTELGFAQALDDAIRGLAFLKTDLLLRQEIKSIGLGHTCELLHELLPSSATRAEDYWLNHLST